MLLILGLHFILGVFAALEYFLQLAARFTRGGGAHLGELAYVVERAVLAIRRAVRP